MEEDIDGTTSGFTENEKAHLDAIKKRQVIELKMKLIEKEKELLKQRKHYELKFLESGENDKFNLQKELKSKMDYINQLKSLAKETDSELNAGLLPTAKWKAELSKSKDELERIIYERALLKAQENGARKNHKLTFEFIHTEESSFSVYMQQIKAVIDGFKNESVCNASCKLLKETLQEIKDEVARIAGILTLDQLESLLGQLKMSIACESDSQISFLYEIAVIQTQNIASTAKNEKLKQSLKQQAQEIQTMRASSEASKTDVAYLEKMMLELHSNLKYCGETMQTAEDRKNFIKTMKRNQEQIQSLTTVENMCIDVPIQMLVYEQAILALENANLEERICQLTNALSGEEMLVPVTHEKLQQSSNFSNLHLRLQIAEENRIKLVKGQAKEIETQKDLLNCFTRFEGCLLVLAQIGNSVEAKKQIEELKKFERKFGMTAAASEKAEQLIRQIKDLSHLKSEKENISRDHENLQGKLLKLKNQHGFKIGEMNVMKAEHENLKTQNKRDNEKIEKLLNELGAMEEKYYKLNLKHTQLRRMSKSKVEIHEDFNELKSKDEILQKSFQEVEKERNELEERVKSLERVVKIQESQVKSLSHHKKSNEILHQEIDTLKTQKVQWNKSEAQLEEQAIEFTLERSKWEEKKRQLEGYETILRKVFGDVDADMIQLVERVARLYHESHGLKETHNLLEQRYAALSDEHHTLQQQLGNSSTDVSQLQREIEEFKEKRKSWMTSVETISAQKQAQDLQVYELEKDVKKLKVEIRMLEKMKAEHSELIKAEEKLREDLKLFEESQKVLEEENVALQQQNSLVAKEKQSLEVVLKRKNEEHARLVKLNLNLQMKLSNNQVGEVQSLDELLDYQRKEIEWSVERNSLTNSVRQLSSAKEELLATLESFRNGSDATSACLLIQKNNQKRQATKIVEYETNIQRLKVENQQLRATFGVGDLSEIQREKLKEQQKMKQKLENAEQKFSNSKLKITKLKKERRKLQNLIKLHFNLGDDLVRKSKALDDRTYTVDLQVMKEVDKQMKFLTNEIKQWGTNGKEKFNDRSFENDHRTNTTSISVSDDFSPTDNITNGLEQLIWSKSIQDLQTKVESLTAERDGLQSKMMDKSLELESEALKSDMQEKQDTIGNLQESLRDFQSEKSQVEESLRAAERQIKRLEKDVKHLENQIENDLPFEQRMNEEVLKLKMEVDFYKDEVRVLRLKQSDSEVKIPAIIKVKDDRIEKLENKLSEAFENVRAKTRLIVLTKKEKRTIEEELEQIQQEISSLRVQNAEFEAENKALGEKLKILTEKSKEAEESQAKTENYLKEINRLIKTIEDLREKTARLTKEREQDAESLTEKMEKIGMLSEENGKMKKQIIEMVAQKETPIFQQIQQENRIEEAKKIPKLNISVPYEIPADVELLETEDGTLSYETEDIALSSKGRRKRKNVRFTNSTIFKNSSEKQN